MFTIKVAFKNKNVLLGKGITSLDAIRSQLAARFPGEQTQRVLLQFKGEELQSFERVREIVEADGLKSIKIEAVLPPKPSSQIQGSKKFSKRSASPELGVKEEIKGEKMDIEEFHSQTQEINLGSGIHVDVNFDKDLEVEQDAVNLTMKKQTESNSKQNIDNDSAQAAAVEEDNEEEKKAIDVKKMLENKAVIIQRNWRRFAAQNKFNSMKKEILRCRPLGKAVETDSEEEVEADQKSEEKSQKPIVQPAQEEIPELVEQAVEAQKNDAPELEEKEKVEVAVEEKASKLSSVVVEPLSELKSQIKVFHLQPFESDDIYRCFYCMGKSSCQACGNIGRFSDESPFIKLIDRLIDARIEKRMNQEKTSSLQQEKMEEIKVEGEPKLYEFLEPTSIKPERDWSSLIEADMSTLDKVWIDDGLNKKKVANEGEQFFWNFRISSPAALKSNIEVNVMDDRSGESMSIKFAPDFQFTVGPFVPKKQSKLEHTYRLFFFNDRSQMKFFGPKFGFCVPVINEVKRPLTSQLRLAIRRLLTKHKKTKSVEYVIENLKVFDINEGNFKEAEEIMEDIIAGLD